MKIYPVILSGGTGTRLWPLSRSAQPKQLLPLVSEKTMLQDTVLRLAALSEAMPPLIVCGNEHRFIVAEQLREIGVSPLGILLEPEGKNTAPAVAAAAHYLMALDRDAVMLILPADHVINDMAAFNAAVKQASGAIMHGALAMFGIVPTCPETGYGYIERGSTYEGSPGCWNVARFVEKPDLATAKIFVTDGNYYWNSGIFLFSAEAYLAELRLFCPEIADYTEAALRDAYSDLDFYRLEENAFCACPPDSIDYAIMEHTSKAVLIPADIGWSDVGSWSALHDVLQADTSGNVLRGDIYIDGVANTLIRSESRMVAAIGVQDLVIVETPDALLVAHKDHVQKVKQVVEFLKAKKRSEHSNHTKVYRPWGSYEGIDIGERYQVKRLTVAPGAKLSLQMHHHRAEHWVVVYGTAIVTCGDKVTLLSENQSTYIPIGVTHRLENPGKLPLHLIEIQSGSYLKEDDIVRFDDIYKRT